MHFSKNLVVCSSAGPKSLAFISHCLANFQPILNCFILSFKLKYEDSQNIKADCVSTVVFNSHQIKCRVSFLEHPVLKPKIINFVCSTSGKKTVSVRYTNVKVIRSKGYFTHDNKWWQRQHVHCR